MSKLEPQALELGNDIQDTRAASKREAMPEQMGDGPFDQPTIGGGDGPTDNWCIARAMSCGAAPSRCCKGLKCETAGEPDGFTWMECKPA
ncbi:hypothetical protein EMCG_07198 [[Emmonsia] crescens]|uniref:Uncharacterized protein n=1 Tax=[Emmonsia] crescens TaxID=73230 RepID=A0A0G2I8Z9_9EURO|nr:hypothetical protein EMCG_07198 [Emmonsia crescens UAMH 3008]